MIIFIVLSGILYLVLGIISLGGKPFFIEEFSTDRILAVFAVFLFLLILYGFLIVRFPASKDISPKKLILFMLPVFIILLFIPPFLSIDVYGYLVHAKNFYVYHQNPYLTPMSAVGENTWLEMTKHVWWADFPSAHGPLFNIFSGFIIMLYSKSLLASLYLYKIFSFGFFILSIFIFDRIIKAVNGDRRALLLYALNPAIIIHSVLEAHNDVIVLVLLLLGIFYLVKKKLIKSFFAIGLSVAVKFIPVILLPVYWIEKRKVQWKNIGLSILITSGVFIVASSIFNFPFLEMKEMLFARNNWGCFYACSLPIELSNLFFGASALTARTIISALLYFFLVYFFLLRLGSPTSAKEVGLPARREEMEAKLKFIFWAFLVLFFIYSAWLASWFLILVIPLALIFYKEKLYLAAGYFLTFYSLLHYFGI